jgi:hypothetical protein
MTMFADLVEWISTVRQNCHPDRSVAKWRDLLCAPPGHKILSKRNLAFVITSMARQIPIKARRAAR